MLATLITLPAASASAQNVNIPANTTSNFTTQLSVGHLAVAQTFTAPTNATGLSDFSFWLSDYVARGIDGTDGSAHAEQQLFSAAVYIGTGGAPSGPALYTSDQVHGPGPLDATHPSLPLTGAINPYFTTPTQYTFDADIPLTAGTQYWVELIYHGTDPADTPLGFQVIYVALGDPSYVSGVGSGFASNTGVGDWQNINGRAAGDLEFQAEFTTDESTSTPEPATLGLVGLGLAGIAGVRRRHRS